jgi:metal-dependent amidase/aminoacylase/carboxypeptidase family protein
MEMQESRKEEIIEIRRYLHENPELSFQEEKTAQYIVDFYKEKDVDIQRNVGNSYGIIVTIKGGKTGKTIGLRADFDALPIVENPYFNHHPQFDIDEDALLLAEKSVGQVVCSYFE